MGGLVKAKVEAPFRVAINDFFIEAQKIHQGLDGRIKDVPKAEYMYNSILTNSPDNPWVLACLGALHLELGHYGLAALILDAVVQHLPDNGDAWANLGLALKHMRKTDDSYHAYLKAAELLPESSDIRSNIAGLFVNMGQPNEVLKYSEEALKLNPDNSHAQWHKGLALLELQRFDEAWDWHEARLIIHHGKNVAQREYHKNKTNPTAQWNGRANILGKRDLVVIHGEQGLGDEVMFGSCIPDAVATGADIIVECSPRLHKLFARSFPDVRVFGTNVLNGSKWPKGFPNPEQVDYKCALGSLPRFYRRGISTFPGTPFLIPNPTLAGRYAKRLERLGDRPKIGIAWQGGVQTTRVDLRSVTPIQLIPILTQDADFISLQYTKEAKNELEVIKNTVGVTVHHWEEAAEARDLDVLAALISQLDLVISVCQTDIHLAGGLGVPTWVMVPSRPSWRYGVEGNMPWYDSVNLYRQQGNDWDGLIETIAGKLKGILNNVEEQL